MYEGLEEVFAVSFETIGGDHERHVVQRWWIAEATAKRAVKSGAKNVRIKRIRTDVWLVDGDGAIYAVSCRVDAGRAASWARDYAGADREMGVLLWPSETQGPAKVWLG